MGIAKPFVLDRDWNVSSCSMDLQLLLTNTVKIPQGSKHRICTASLNKSKLVRIGSVAGRKV